MLRFATAAVIAIAVGFACGDDADDFGVGAQCAGNADCDPDTMQVCLQFKGGYCGIMGCTADADCPDLSSCVAHSDGVNYCFRNCIDKGECNRNRDPENEANCSANITFVEPANNQGLKACVPPSG
ncbi:MAG TPA: hypothetical protein VIV11_10665 [Kofleriaceae bacterium]